MTRRSMTAYARASFNGDHGLWHIEISSVNRKGLDLSITLPPDLQFLDPLLRKWIGAVTERGAVNIRLFCRFDAQEPLMNQLRLEKEKWSKISKELGFEGQVTLPFLLEHLYAPRTAELNEQALKKELLHVWNEASQAWICMKEKEGITLAGDISKRLVLIEKQLKQIEKEVPAAVKAKEKKVLESLKTALGSQEIKEIYKEILFELRREDITEELTRLKSHIKQFKDYLASSKVSVGKTLDFLTQEMGREIGTLMAKASSVEIGHLSVQVKEQIEKIREQVQNIE